jgi:hypothetical protein
MIRVAIQRGRSTALLDRLLHHAHVLKCGPRSSRTKVQTDLRTREETKYNSLGRSGNAGFALSRNRRFSTVHRRLGGHEDSIHDNSECVP